MKINPLYLIIYFLAFLVTGLGVILIIRSDFGAGPWDTTIYNLSHLLNITLGASSALVNTTILLFVTIYNRKIKYILVLVPIIFVSLSLNFWDLFVFSTFNPTSYAIRTVLFIAGLFILTFGLALIYITRYPAMIFEEFTFALMKLLKIKSFFTTRIIIELLAITLAIIFGFMASIGFGQVNIGSIVIAVIIGPVIGLQIKWLKKVRTKFERYKNQVNA